jgi:hypothetical protein
MRFKVKDSNLFLMPGNPHLLHLGSIAYGLREFVVMTCVDGPHKGNTYIEEVVLESKDFSKDVFASLKFIDDNNLAFDLAKFAEENGLTDMKKRAEELIDRGKTQWLAGSTDLRKLLVK